METYSLWHALLLLVFVLVLVFFSRALRKAGYSPWWAVLGAIPVVNILLLWVFAYAQWPRLPHR